MTYLQSDNNATVSTVFDFGAIPNSKDLRMSGEENDDLNYPQAYNNIKTEMPFELIAISDSKKWRVSEKWDNNLNYHVRTMYTSMKKVENFSYKPKKITIEKSIMTSIYLMLKDLTEEYRGTRLLEYSKRKISTRSAVTDLYRKGGLEWNEIADIFSVDQDTINDWISGKPLSGSEEKFLYQLADLIDYINEGSSYENRKLLNKKIEKGKTALKLIKKGKFDLIKKFLGKGRGEDLTEFPPLSEEEIEARKPFSLKVLVSTVSKVIQVEKINHPPSSLNKK